MPFSKKVYIFTAPDELIVCRGKTICNAVPALDDFAIKAEEIFV